jgi:hypothetical protein
LELDDLLIDILTLVSVHHVRVDSAILLVHAGISLSITDCWGNGSCETEWNLNNLLVAAVGACEHSFSCSDGTFACGNDNTGNGDEFTYQITLKISEHLWVLIGMNLNLESWGNLHIWVHLIVVISFVNNFNSRLENFDEIIWIISEIFHQDIVKSVKVLHVNFNKIFTPLSIALKLFSVNKNIVHLGLPDEMHEFIFGLSKTLLVCVTHVSLSVDQILISEVDLVSVESHLSF